jgi:hypothetical protein
VGGILGAKNHGAYGVALCSWAEGRELGLARRRVEHRNGGPSRDHRKPGIIARTVLVVGWENSNLEEVLGTNGVK